MLVLLCVAVCFVGCEDEMEAPVGMQKASNDAAGYTMYVSEDWIVNESSGVTSAVAGVGRNTTVTAAKVTNDTDATDPVKYFEQYKTRFTSVMSDFHEQDEPIDELLGGVGAKRFTYTGTVSDVLRKYSTVIAMSGDDVYILTFTSTKDEYDTYYVNFEEILQTFVVG